MGQMGILGTGILLPLIGTALGAFCVFFCRNGIPFSLGKALSGFASGVMLASSVWSLLLPAGETAKERGISEALPMGVGFAWGVGFLLLLDLLSPWIRKYFFKEEQRRSLFVFAVTLHNLPEGMAVGVLLAGFLHAVPNANAAGVLAFTVGIALQNIPEGAIISLPAHAEGASRSRAFVRGVLSGAVEPIGALCTLWLSGAVVTALPFILAFAAGAMVYVSVGELIPEALSGRRTGADAYLGTLSVTGGFLMMMLLDVLLG